MRSDKEKDLLELCRNVRASRVEDESSVLAAVFSHCLAEPLIYTESEPQFDAVDNIMWHHSV